MKYGLILLLTLLLLPCEGVNMLQNPDFEKQNTRQLPDQWGIGIGTPRAVIQENGSTVLKLGSENRNGRNKVSISQSIPRLHSGLFIFRGRIKGNVVDLIAVLRFPKGTNPTVRVINIPKTQMTKKNGWFEFSKEITIPNGPAGSTLLVIEPGTEKAGDILLLDNIFLGQDERTSEKKDVVPTSVPAVKTVLEIKDSLVSSPRAATQVRWSTYPVAGKDFWQLLRPVWHEMQELKEEPFVKNAGYSLPHHLYLNRGVLRGDLRKTQIREIEVFCDGKNVAQKLKFDFDSIEKDTLFYDMEKCRDGNLSTSGYIIGNPADFRRRHAGVPVKIVVSGCVAPVEKIRFLSSVHGCSPFASIEVFDESGRLQNASYERNASDNEWILTFRQSLKGNSFVVKAMTAPSLFSPAPIQEEYKEVFKKVPFATHHFFFRGRIAELKRENIDIQAIRRVKKEYPETYIGEIFCEIAANYFQRLTRPTRFREQLTEQGYYVSTHDRNRFDAEDGLRTHVKRYYDFFDPLPSMSGGLMSLPYFFEWGSPLGFSESWTEQPTGNNRSLITISRSGSRQYSRPWGFYMTSFAHSGTANSIRTEDEAIKLSNTKFKCGAALDFGLAPSVLKRLQYLSYYAGVNYHMFETDHLGLSVQDKKTGKWSLTENGKGVKELYEWTVTKDGKRGEMYTPILLLADYYHGNWDWRRGAVWYVWYMHPFEDGDYMFQHINRTFDLAIPRNGNRESQLKDGWGLANSKLGDIYDIFFANPPSGIVTQAELGKYPVVFLIGNIRYSKKLVDELKTYVRNGGTLIVNAAQDERFFADVAFSGVTTSGTWTRDGEMNIRKLDTINGKILASSASGLPLIVKNTYGKGHVIFMTPYYLLDMDNKKNVLALIPPFLEKLQSEVIPVQVSGKIHFLFNKMSEKKWKLVLFNHRGVYKDPYRSKEEVDPSYASTVTLTIPEGVNAKEVRLHQPLQKKGNKLTLTVPSGEICVVDLDNVPFEGTAMNMQPLTRKGGFYDKLNSNSGVHLDSDFSKQKGDVAADASGKGNNGTICEAEYEKDSFKFDGKKSYVHYFVGSLQDPVTEGAFECWLNPDPAIHDGKHHIAMTNQWIKLGIKDNRWCVDIYDMSKNDTMYGPAVIFGKWHHLVFTWKDMIADMYVDGVKVERPDGPFLHINALEQDNKQLFLGTHHYLRTAMFKGLMRGIRYHGNYLTSDNVLSAFQAENKNLQNRQREK